MTGEKGAAASLTRRGFIRIVSVGSAGAAGLHSLGAAEAGLQGWEQGDSGVYDVVVYGGTSAGIVAGVQVARMGRSVLLIEPSRHLGGLTAGGLGHTDSGRAETIGGVSREFYRRIRAHYENPDVWRHETREQYRDHWHSPSRRHLETERDAQWGFEPHAARKVFDDMLREAGVPLITEERLFLDRERGVVKNGSRITSILMESGEVYRGRIFIDATYEGDLLAMAGVSYHVGREANRTYGETLNGIQKARTHNHVFIHDVDPYVVPGVPTSGLLPGLHGDDPGVDGEEDHRVQAYCFRMCLTDVPENRVSFEKPDGFEESRYELLFRNFESGEDRIPWLPGMMPNRKTDTNNRWAVSSNNIGANYDYPDGDYSKRAEILADHEIYQRGLMYVLANHLRVPEEIRREVGKWGLARDEFVDSSHWPPQIYVREARRMIGEYVTSELDCRRLRVCPDPAGQGSYNMDSHNVQRYVTERGVAQNEGNLEFGPGGPYLISYRSLVPRRRECSNLLVCCAVSSSHIAFGSVRMEPVFMILAQSAATAAVQALEEEQAVQGIDYPRLRERLLKEGQILELDLDRFPPRREGEALP
jgi:hypothetical protein